MRQYHPHHTKPNSDTLVRPADRVEPYPQAPVFDPENPEQRELFKVLIAAILAVLIGMLGWSLFRPTLTSLLLLDMSESALAYREALAQVCRDHNSVLKTGDRTRTILFADRAAITAEQQPTLLEDTATSADCNTITSREQLAALGVGAQRGTSPRQGLNLAKSYLQIKDNPRAVVILVIHTAEPGEDFADTAEDIATAVRALTQAKSVVRIISFDPALQRELQQQLSAEEICIPQAVVDCIQNAHQRVRSWWP